MNVETCLRVIARRLVDQGIVDPAVARIEARLLAQEALGTGQTWLIAHGTDTLTPARIAAIEALTRRRLAGEPMAYILGEREFHGRVFRVSPATLIPRPETEHLVEAALARGPTQARVLDIGTGSGCIAITLKLERPDWRVTGVDISHAALEVARGNADRLGAEIDWLESDLFAALSGRTYDLIVSNPPYVAESDPHMSQGDVRFEPRSALTSGDDGLDAIRAVITQAGVHLSASGWLLLEHGWDQAEPVGRLLASAGFTEIFLERDLAGLARVSGGLAPR
jgi:release factor glutamine methyltransferase